jgi:hypothetical protein
VEVRPGKVRITWQQADEETPDPGQINAYVTEQVNRLQFYLYQSATQFEMFNRELASRAAGLVAARKDGSSWTAMSAPSPFARFRPMRNLADGLLARSCHS